MSKPVSSVVRRGSLAAASSALASRSPFAGLAMLVACVAMSALFGVAIVAPAAAQAPPDSSVFQYVKDIRFGTPPCIDCPPRVCPGEPVIVTVRGVIPNCVEFRRLEWLPTAGPFPVVAARFDDNGCVARCLPGTHEFSASIDLGPAGAPGSYPVVLLEQQRACLDTTQLDFSNGRQVVYVVMPECPPPPPPPTLDSLLRSFTSLRVLPERPCAGDSVRVQLVKHGCPPCVHLTSFAFTRARGLLATLDWTPLCAEFRCSAESLSVELGVLPAGFHQLTVSTDVRILSMPDPDSVITFERRLGFQVSTRCDTTSGGCFDPQLPPSGSPLPECTLRLRPGSRGDIVLPVRTAVPAAGVEGFIHPVAPFRITNVAYAGSARGVQVSWRRDGGLTRFVVFSTLDDAVPTGLSGLLKLTIAADSALTAGPESATLSGMVTLASDAHGNAIPFCPEPGAMPAFLTICLDRSPIRGCDVNADGHTDVRDLVRMAICLRHRTPGDAACHDCDRDGTFGIPDLFCCARDILGGGGVPGDSAVVLDGLVVSIDPPVGEGSGVLVRVRVRGADALGGALLRLRYPADRWRVTPPADPGAGFAQGWLPLVDANEAGLLRVGALRLSDAADAELVYHLYAEPLSGAIERDALVVEGADLTAPDGAVYAPSAALPRAELSPPPLAATVELSPARPNPFGRTTSFNVSLPRESAVELTVHDLAGRKVATLAHGRLAAGRRAFTWDASGARDGVYFVRLVVDGRVLSTRVALLRDSGASAN